MRCGHSHRVSQEGAEICPKTKGSIMHSSVTIMNKLGFEVSDYHTYTKLVVLSGE